MTSVDWWDEVAWWTDPRLAYAKGLDEARAQYDLGWLAASEAYGAAIMGALERPLGHGGPDLDEATRSTIREIYARYAGVPDYIIGWRPGSRMDCGCKFADVVQAHGRLHGALVVDPGLGR